MRILPATKPTTVPTLRRPAPGSRRQAALTAARTWAFALVAAVAAAPSAFAQTTGSADNGGTANTGGGLTPVGPTPEDAFSGGIERNGVVGESSVTVGGGQQAGNNGGASGRNSFGGGGGFGGAFGNAFGSLFGNNNSGQSDRPTLRTRLRSAVSVTPLPPRQVSVNAQRRFRQIPAAGRLGDVRVTMQARKAVLTGSVDSADRRRMAELMVRLEPGVSTVDNRVVVVESPAASVNPQNTPTQ